MPNRKKPGEEKILPCFSFKVPIEITFSIATTRKKYNDLNVRILNLNKNVSDVFKNEVLFRDLNLKSKADIDNYCADGIKLIKDKMYKDLGICRKKSFGNDYIIIEAEKCVSKQEGEIGIK